MSGQQYKATTKEEKERKIYDYLKKAIFESFAKDETEVLLVDIEPYLKSYQIEYDVNNKPFKISKGGNRKKQNNKNTFNTNNYNSYDSGSSSLGPEDLYGFNTHGGTITLNGDYVPSYGDRDDNGYFGSWY